MSLTQKSFPYLETIFSCYVY